MFVQLASGDLYTYGYNGYGQIGNGTTTNALTPYRVFTGTVSDIIGDCQGWYYDPYITPTPIIKKTDGTYWCWGYGPFGQVGNGGSASTYTTPTQMVFNKGTVIKFLSTLDGSNNSGIARIAVTSNNTLIAYGYNAYWTIDPSASGQNLYVPIEYTPNNLRK
jgi:alpha-tubulin suppressor-like RCC1 family protein